MVNKSCRGCGKVGRSSICSNCKRKNEQRRPSPSARGYDAEYKRLRKIVVDHARLCNLPCWQCGKHFSPADTITVDHVRPLRNGGRTTLDNLAPACEKCNYSYGRGRP